MATDKQEPPEQAAEAPTAADQVETTEVGDASLEDVSGGSALTQAAANDLGAAMQRYN
jgi:hypothetical protein